MLHITEDTPADMLSGAMDLTIHLPSGKATKMCVERSTPMMDLLVQITTNHQLQITNYTLQPMQTAPDNSYSDKVLSYYPNTPIGALDTQHVRIMPKTRTLPVQKNVPAGHQPFESTFRLKVHLPRNQLFVTRVSRHVHIGDIMRKVCEEKNLDPNKCEVRHPGNLDEELDPKLTLNDYMITEIYLTLKGSNSLTQTFSANDIMTLRKEEERKHLQSKTGGGVFNLIFRRGKSNAGSGSTSTIGNSVSPPNSEVSRSVTPPVVPVQMIAPAKMTGQPEKPRVPQRKRRPAPKPPQPGDNLPQNDPVEGKVSSIVSDNSATSDICVKNETNVMICHSRHSSDSSGYHETSILSDHCNTSLPRKVRGVERERAGKSLNRHSHSIGNLTKMTEQSRSTSSLAFPGRKKKAAPPPPMPLQESSSSTLTTQKPSPVVASQTPVSYSQSITDKNTPSFQGPQNIINPPPVPRRRKGPIAVPRPKSMITVGESETLMNDSSTSSKLNPERESIYDYINVCPYQEGEMISENSMIDSRTTSHISTTDILKSLEYLNLDDQGNLIKPPEIIALLPKSVHEIENGPTETNETLEKRPFKLDLVDNNLDDYDTIVETEFPAIDYLTSLDSDITNLNSPINKEGIQNEVFSTSLRNSRDVQFQMREMKRWGSWEKLNQPSTPPPSSFPLDDFIDEFLQHSTDDSYFTSTQHNCESKHETQSEQNVTDICNENYIPAEFSVSNDVDVLQLQEKKTNIDKLESESMVEDFIDFTSDDSYCSAQFMDFSETKTNSLLVSRTLEGVIGGEQSYAESLSTVGLQSIHSELDSKDNIENLQNSVINARKIEDSGDINNTKKASSYTDLTIDEEYLRDIHTYIDYRKSPQDSGNSSDISEKSKLDEELSNEDLISSIQPDKIEYETEEWQLPSPPKAFKDSTSDTQSEQLEMSNSEGSIISQELLKKLKCIEEQQTEHKDKLEETYTPSDNASTISDDRPLLTSLSLENLEKRKSLVYNRELATSLKLSFDSNPSPPLARSFQSDIDLSKSFNQFEKTLEDIRNANQQDIEKRKKVQSSIIESTLPNFKITTYDEPKEKIKVFEDDTIYSNSDSASKSIPLNKSYLLRKTNTGRSIENISLSKNDSEEVLKRTSDLEHRIFRPKSEQFRRSVNRSGSFSTDQNEWSPSKPVTRSKSQVAYKREEISRSSLQTDNLSKSSSLFDVSGLQSLEVMRKIQNKLNTPSASTETLSKIETVKKTEIAPRKIQYMGPPAVNMSTWSERPKIPVSVKEDEDYKLGQGTNKLHSSVIINSSTESSMGNGVAIKHTTYDNLYSFPKKTENKNVTIKINGCEPISSQKNGNLLIKIGEPNNKFQEFNSDLSYRQPLNSLTKNSVRPHSVAFPSDFDISRVPVVRSVELKKNFKDASNNSSTNISNPSKVSYPPNGYPAFSKYPSNENLNKSNYFIENGSKPVFRTKSFLQPIVKGFRNFDNANGSNEDRHNNKNRYSWQPTSSMTLPSNVSARQTYVTNQNVPFSKFNLRKTESKMLIEDERTDILQNTLDHNRINTSAGINFKYQESNGDISMENNKDNRTKSDIMTPPQPPQMPKVVHKKISNRQFVPVADPRNELLKSIRDFGGKKGLRSRKT